MEGQHIQEMFHAIAPRYDFLNRLLSVKQDIKCRKALVEALRLPDNSRVLDIATGTGDVAIEVVRRKGRSVTVWGVDFALGMLQLGRKKIAGANLDANIRQAQGDAFYPPFKQGVFDAVTCAFGIRNISDKKKVLKVFFDLLKPGGQVLILELTLPKTGFMKYLYLIYFQRVLPVIGKMISKVSEAYSYLPQSVLHFPPRAAFCSLLRDAGFEDVSCKPLTVGICTLFSGVKPEK